MTNKLTLLGACVLLVAIVALRFANRQPTVLTFVTAKSYRLSYQQEGAANAMGMTQTSSVSVHGTLQFSEDKALVFVQFFPRDVRYSVNGQEAGASLAGELSKPLKLSRAANGQIESLWFEDGVSDRAQALLRDMLARTQVVVSPAGASEWSVSEEDDNGAFVAKYAVIASGAERVSLKKSIVANESRRVDGDATIELALPGILRSLRSDQTFHVFLGGSEIASWVLKVSLEEGVDADLATSSAAAIAYRQAVPHPLAQGETLGGALAKARDEQRIQKEALAGESEDDLYERLSDLTMKGRNAPSSAKRDAVLKLYAYVYLNPERAQALASTLSTVAADSAEFSYIVGALSQVGSPSAQHALAGAIDACSADPRKLALLIPSLALVPEPLPETQTKLENLIERSDAVLALGIVADRIANKDSVRAGLLLQVLIKELKAAQTPARRNAVLAGLGNTSAPAAAAAALPWLEAKEPTTRIAAARAMRFVLNDNMVAAVLRRLPSEDDDMVRYDLVGALSYRPQSSATIAAQANALGEETSPLVRGQLIRNLWEGRHAYANAETMVRGAAQNDKSPEVRQIARTLLAGQNPS